MLLKYLYKCVMVQYAGLIHTETICIVCREAAEVM